MTSLGIFLLFNTRRGLSSSISLSVLTSLAFPFPFDTFDFSVGVRGESRSVASADESIMVGFSMLMAFEGFAFLAASRGRPKSSDFPDKKYLRPRVADEVGIGAAPINTGILPAMAIVILLVYKT